MIDPNTLTFSQRIHMQFCQFAEYGVCFPQAVFGVAALFGWLGFLETPHRRGLSKDGFVVLLFAISVLIGSEIYVMTGWMK